MQEIKTPHYHGLPSVNGDNLSVEIKPSKIYEGIPITLTKGAQPIIKNGRVWEANHTNVFSYSVEDYKRYGRLTHPEDNGKAMDSWKAAGEDVKPADYGPVSSVLDNMKNQGAIYAEGEPKLMNVGDGRSTQTYNYVHPNIISGVRFNDLGKFVSKSSNAWQYMNELLADEAGRPNKLLGSWTSFLHKNGYKPSNGLKGIGAMDYQGRYKGAFASVTRDTNVLTIATDFQSKIGQEIKALEKFKNFDLKGREGEKALKEYVLLHELYHVAGGRSEEEVGWMLAEFYHNLAEQHRESQKGNIYHTIARLAKAYALGHKKSLRGILDVKNPNQDNLESIITEARMEAESIGLKGSEADNYIAIKASKYKKSKSKGNKDYEGSNKNNVINLNEERSKRNGNTEERSIDDIADESNEISPESESNGSDEKKVA